MDRPATDVSQSGGSKVLKVSAEELQREYDQRLPLFKQLRDEALFILETSLNKPTFKYHSLSSRIKTFDSVLGKAKRKELAYPMREIHDFVGLRVVCLFLSDVTLVAEVIRATFDVLEEDNKIEGEDLSSFGYMSFHFKVQMKPTYAGPRYDAISSMPFEIQLRTIAMDAWAATSHYLDYKTEADIPSELRRDFYALSGLFYVADRHFEMFFRSRETKRKDIASTLYRDHPLFDQEINLDSLTAYLHLRFATREHSEPVFVSELLTEILAANVTTLKDLDALIAKHWKWLEAREKSDPPLEGPPDEDGKLKETVFADIGVVRMILKKESGEY